MATHRVITFHSDAVEDDTLAVHSFSGSEAISRLFRFDLNLVSRKADLDFSGFLAKPAWLGIQQSVPIAGGGRGTTTLKIHGVLASFEQAEKSENWVSYHAVLVPRPWDLSLNTHTRVFLDKKVPDILEEVLKEAGLTGQDYELKTSASYAAREYVVQYRETDLDFIQRLMEHEGIFYFFDHQDAGSKVVIADSIEAFVPIPGGSSIPYRTTMAVAGAEGGWTAQEGVQAIACRQNMIPKEVVLRDYNYRTPGVDLKGSAPVDPDGRGTVYLYGEHYKDQGEGKAYAKIRAEELLCRKKGFEGAGDAKAFRSGMTFKLTDHYRSDFNAQYLLTRVLHRGAQAIEHLTSATGASGYRNEFTCIPADAPFRPERVTPRPRIPGAINAKVDAAGSGQYAEIDDQGRYKVTIPFDLSGNSGGSASRYVRMEQPYGGDGMGFHAPLHKGVEVNLLHVNGDPDRPYIAGTVPNPETASMVTGSNQTQCVFKSGGNNEFRYEDTSGSEQVYLHAQKDWVISVENDKTQTVGHDEKLEVKNNRTKVVGVDESITIGSNETISTGANHSETIGSNMDLTVGASKTETVGADETDSVGGNVTVTVGANKTETVAIASAETVGAAKALSIGAAYAVTVGAVMSETVGAAKSETVGASKTENVAANKSETIGGNRGLTVGGILSIDAGKDATLSSGGNVAETAAKEFVIKGKSVRITADNEISIQVGKALINMKKNGDILIEGKKIDVKGSGDIVMKGSKIKEN